MYSADGEYDADFFILLFVVAPVALLGMVGNIICLIILKRNSYNVVTVKLFQAIVIANTLYIAFVIASRLHEILSATNNNMPDIVSVGIEAYVKVAFIPLCHTIIVYLIVLVTLDRYTTVFKPCGIAYLCHGNTAIFRVIFGIVGLAVVVNLPHFFEMYISYAECSTNSSGNSTINESLPLPTLSSNQNRSTIVLETTSDVETDVEMEVSGALGDVEMVEDESVDPESESDGESEFDDSLHRCRSANQSEEDAFGVLDGIQPYPSEFVNTPVHHAYRVFELLATELVPVVLIIVMNARLICVMQHLMVRRAQSIHAQRRSEYRAVLVTLVILVSVFIVCEMPMFTLKMAELIEKLLKINGKRTTYAIFYSVSQLFVQISASTNFIVYFCSNPVHRQQLWALLRCNCSYEKSSQRLERTDTDRAQHLLVSIANPSWKRCWRFLRQHDGVTTSVETESVYARIRAQRILYNQYFRDTQMPSPPRRACYYPTEVVATQQVYHHVRFQPVPVGV